MQCFYIFISKTVSDNISIAKVRKYGQCDSVWVREGYNACEKHYFTWAVVLCDWASTHHNLLTEYVRAHYNESKSHSVDYCL